MIKIDASELQALREEIAAARDYSGSAHNMRKALRALKHDLAEKKADVKELNAKIKELTLDLEEHLDDNPLDPCQPNLPWVEEDIHWQDKPIACLGLPHAISSSFTILEILTLGELNSFDRTALLSDNEAQIAEFQAMSEWGEGRWTAINDALEKHKAASGETSPSSLQLVNS